jgi:hypothetical protein
MLPQPGAKVQWLSCGVTLDDGRDIIKVRKTFFSEEKKQKTFMSLSRFYPATGVIIIKVFWFFFSKKNFFLT